MIQEKTYSAPRPRQPLRIWLQRRLRSWPALLWLGLVLFAIVLYQRSAEFGHIVGVVESIDEPVAPLETARLSAISVALGQRVKAGQELARMDTAGIDDELAISRAELQEAEETITGYQQNVLQMVAQAERTLREADTAYQSEVIRQASQAAELKTLKDEQQRRADLFKRQLISERDVYELRPQISALEQEVIAGPKLITTYEQPVRAARKQVAEMREWLRVETGASISDAIRAKMKARRTIFDATMTMLENRAKTYTLRAARDGVVSQVFLIPGNVVNAGTPVLTLVSENPQNVIGFLPEIHIEDLPVSRKVVVWRSRDSAKKVPAEVTSVAPDVRALPARISPMGNQTIRGRRVVLVLLGEHDFIPGETVEISLTPVSLKDMFAQLLKWHPF